MPIEIGEESIDVVGPGGVAFPLLRVVLKQRLILQALCLLIVVYGVDQLEWQVCHKETNHEPLLDLKGG